MTRRMFIDLVVNRGCNADPQPKGMRIMKCCPNSDQLYIIFKYNLKKVILND